MKSLSRLLKGFVRGFLRYPINFARRTLIRWSWRWLVGVVMAFVIGGGVVNFALPQNHKLVADIQKYEKQDLGLIANLYFDFANKFIRLLDHRNTLETVKGQLDGVTSEAGQKLEETDVSAPGLPNLPSLPTVPGLGANQPETQQAGGGQSGQPGAVSQGELIDHLIATPTTGEEFNFSYYAVLGNSQLDPSTFPTAGEIQYSPLDDYGRTRTARGSLTFANVEASYGKREKFSSSSNPSGWGFQYKATIDWKDPDTGETGSYNGFFYNRSHLIADSLGGSANRDNLVTGTRPQNVGGGNHKGGMRYGEIKAKEYLEQNQEATLYYEAEPVYAEAELIPRAVVVRMLSSDGSIDETVLVYNNAYNHTINYKTGVAKVN